MFNKSYHARAKRGALVSARAILEELVERAGDRESGFYRPTRRTSPRVAANQCKKPGAAVSSLQLELFPIEESADEMFERLFPA